MQKLRHNICKYVAIINLHRTVFDYLLAHLVSAIHIYSTLLHSIFKKHPPQHPKADAKMQIDKEP